MPTIGLFGTCGKSKWREPFIQEYTKSNIQFFNPQVDDWNPECAKIEAEHLAQDEIILFPVTGETYGTGSLAETGFSILNAIRMDSERDIVVLIEKDLDESLDDEVARKESIRARTLLLEHLSKLRLKNVYLVSKLKTMFQISLVLYGIAQQRATIKKFSLGG